MEVIRKIIEPVRDQSGFLCDIISVPYNFYVYTTYGLLWEVDAGRTNLGVAIAQSEVSNYGDGSIGRQTLLDHDRLVHGADFCDRHRGRPSDEATAPPADPRCPGS